MSPHYKLLTEVRAYLIRRSEDMKVRNIPEQLLQYYDAENGFAVIFLDSSIDRGLTDQHFVFDSGARLCFGLTVTTDRQHSSLISFRFHYTAPEKFGIPFLRFELSANSHTDPLSEPLCHIHPGVADIRIPIDLHDPFAVLDRIFFRD